MSLASDLQRLRRELADVRRRLGEAATGPANRPGETPAPPLEEVREDASAALEEVTAAREEAAATRKEALATRHEVAAARQEASAARREVSAAREEAADVLEEAADVLEEAVDAGEPAETGDGAPTDADADDGVTAVQPGRLEKARRVALNMALNGAAREETERYLIENLNIPSPTALLSEVYGRESTERG